MDSFDVVAETVKKTAFKISLVGVLVGQKWPVRDWVWSLV